ncbi:hypothetical protein SADUNF_Sadunf07G0039200 [Salix dunnii]|uniref:Uncharacterized protein n=1 Tax=Salix dunnii TaxID=1413687 RepID=A0A835K4N3_9ROSI|nr:hypothetical protein SADUNF_Sadunf07G0039200 [Salix dunnii]
MGKSNNLPGWLRFLYVIFAFFSAFFLGALKGLLVGPIASSVLILGNVAVILGMFPPHVSWTVYTLVKTNRFDIPLKVALLLALPTLFGLWLGLSIAGTVLVGLGYGFFTPWFASFEAFRHGDDDSKTLYHCVVDGSWGTIKGSCIVVTDFADICCHSYPLYLKELRESSASNEIRTLRLIHVPGSIIAGLVGLIVDVPLFAAIVIIKSPYMLFKGWYRLLHDLISREGPFLETACIPIAGLTILLWPLVVVGSILVSIFTSIFIGLYASVILYQERSFWRAVAYVIAMVAEFDEYTNDRLYLREGTFLPKPKYQKKRTSHSSELSADAKFSSVHAEAPAILIMVFLMCKLTSGEVRETIQEVKMVQVWVAMMRSCEMRGKDLLDAGAITPADLNSFLKAKGGNEASVISVGLPCYSFLQSLLNSIKAGSDGFLLLDGTELTHLNRPNDKLFDWFFQPLMVLKEQIRVIKLEEGEERFLQRVVLYGNDTQRMETWDNGSLVPQEALRAAQIQGITRRMIGIIRGISKFPTYRRKFRQVVKTLIAYNMEKESVTRPSSMPSVAGSENV